jgi:ABC-2 type transport system permease protein
VDRLIALVALRWRMDVRGILGARERLFGLVLLLPFLALGSLAAAGATFVAVRALDRTHPEWVLPAVSVAATMMGFFWALSPVLTGIAFSETHDLSRLVHFPVPLPTLVVSSLLANLAEPMVLAKLPLLVALAGALASGPLGFLAAFASVLLAFAFTLVATQLMGLLFLGLARNRRAQDRALFLGLGFGFLLSLLPVFVMTGGAWALRGVARWVLERDLFALSPFAWGARAAVHAGRAEALPFLLFAGAAALAVVVAGGLSGKLAGRIYRGELDLGDHTAESSQARGARMLLSGPLGALVEKDLRVTWRDPRLKAVLFTGLLGPVLILLFWRGTGGAVSPGFFFMLATATGIGTFGANALGQERRGLLLLLGFPFPRWQVLVAKNLGSMLLRLPALLMLLVAASIVRSPALAPPVLVIGLVTLLIGAGTDNFVSVLFPVTVPDAGRNPYGAVSGGRGLGAGMLSAVLFMGSLLATAPFAFLAWLPSLLDEPWLAVVTLPLGLAGAAAIYAMMVAGAARLLSRREPEVLARVLGEE